jgi:molecular chaperone HscB
MTSDFKKNHFELFGLAPAFRIETAQLENAYRDVQSRVHPDRFAAASDAEKRVSMQWATRANEAYQTLKRPLPRARYLLALQGVDTQEESNTSMPADFLMLQMEWREAAAEARARRDSAALDRLTTELQASEKAMLYDLERHLDGEKNLAAAAALVRKLRFIEKLGEEIADAHEAMEN